MRAATSVTAGSTRSCAPSRAPATPVSRWRRCMADVMPSTRPYALTPVDGGITAPTGFRSAAVHCGIKATPGALDLAVIAVDTFASMAALFTTNLAQAAPVLVSKRHLEIIHGVGCAIVVNSGCANACTGADGLANATAMASETAVDLGCEPEQVLVASTGVIGVGLNMDLVDARHHAIHVQAD